MTAGTQPDGEAGEIPGQSAAGGPRARSRRSGRERILNAAIGAICERGLSGTRVADIAQRAEMSPGHVMYYFDTLEQILMHALRMANERFLDDAVREARRLPQARQQLLRLIELGMPSDPSQEPHSQWLLWLDVWARSPRDPTVDADRRRLEKRWIDTYADLVELGQKTGEFSPDADPQDFAIRLGAIVDGLGKSVVLGDDWMTRDRMLDICTRMIARELGDSATAATHEALR
ncbi:MAG TPA: TetR/AcrR family transcriptional regulator [Streptosporangiaceae bacterium]|nr:TetR/AcrR family transcriptional regulator [Streptosporangiaceae bacterium]